MANRTLTYPPEMAGFRPHGTGRASIQGGDGTIFHAALGGIGDDKASFKVYVWSEKLDGTLALISVTDPPNNAPSFYTVGGRLVLTGVLETAPNMRILVERDIPGYLVPNALDPRVNALVTGIKGFLGIK